MSRSKLRPVSEFYSETSPKRQFNEIVVVRSYDLLNQKTKNSLPPFLMYLVFFWRVKFLRCGAAPLCCFNKTEHEAPIVSTKPTTHNYNNVQNSQQIICSNKTVWKMKYAPEKQILWILQVFFFFFPPKSALSRYQFKKKERKEQLCSSPKPLLALVRLEKVKEKAPSCFYQVEREMDIHRKAKHTVNYDFCCTFIQLLRT